MRVTRINLENYRQYSECTYNFPTQKRTDDGDRDAHIIIGKNTGGKSNLLNAINWCLYNKEPHLKVEGRAIQIPSSKLVHNAQIGSLIPVKVEIELEDDTDIIYFEKSAVFQKVSDTGNRVVSKSNELVVKIQDSSGNCRIHESESASEAVERYFPEGIREVIFFDGEKLYNYFAASSLESIRSTITVVSQVHYLQIVEQRLTAIRNEIRKKVSSASPRLSQIEADLETQRNLLAAAKDRLSELNGQLSIMEARRIEINNILRNTPNVSVLQEQIERLESQIKDQKDKKQTLNQSLNRIGSEFLVLACLYEDMISMQETIKTMREKDEIPPKVDRQLLEQMLDEETCTICSSELDDEKKIFIKKLLESINYSSDLIKLVMEQDNQLSVNVYKYEDKGKDWVNTLTEINSADQEIQRLEKLLDDEMAKLANIPDIERAKDLYEERETLQKNIATKNREIALKEQSISDLKAKINSLEQEYDIESKKVKLNKQLNNELLFSSRLLDVVVKSKEELILETVEDVRKLTEENFRKLNWAEDKYTEVLLSDDFELDVIQDGSSAIGSLSTAETALLALAYILAIHKITNLTAPLFIDTPISSIADENRKNFSVVLSEISKTKQLVLLMTSDEYSDQVKSVFFDKCSSIRDIIQKKGESFMKEANNA